MNTFKRVQDLYNKEVRKECDFHKNRILKCFNDLKGDENICKEEILLFQSCIENFNKKFKSKYDGITKFKIN